MLERMDDGYSEPVEMRNYLRFLVFSKYRFLTRFLVRNVHQTLENRSVEKQMKLIEQTGLESIPGDTCREVQPLVEHLKASQFNHSLPKQLFLLERLSLKNSGMLSKSSSQVCDMKIFCTSLISGNHSRMTDCLTIWMLKVQEVLFVSSKLMLFPEL